MASPKPNNVSVAILSTPSFYAPDQVNISCIPTQSPNTCMKLNGLPVKVNDHPGQRDDLRP